MNNWKNMLAYEAKDHGDDLAGYQSTLSESEMERNFYDGHGSANGEAFHVWTDKRVYFAVVYDGAEWVGSVPRNPSDDPPEHHGGQ